MAYIGKTPVIGNFQVCDAITVVDAQAAYTMQVSSVDVFPESANHMLVSLNGILQAPTSSFTVSGSTITFASALETGDVIDFIQILGNVLDLGVPSDNTVTTAKLADSSVSLAKLTATGTKDATTFLRGDNTFDTPPLGGITEYDMFRLTSDFQDSATITSNLERVDTNFEKIGTGMTESSGVFTFPSTGKYEVRFTATAKNPDATGVRNYVVNIQFTTDNSSYSNVASSSNNIGYYSSSVNNWQTTSAFVFLDITDTSNMKVKFDVVANGNSNAYTQSSTTNNITYMTFIKIGNT
jgi:hypothetical protein